MATIAKTKEEPYYPDGGYGWVIVGAVILINVSLLYCDKCQFQTFYLTRCLY